LYNRSHFLIMAETEFERAHRHHHSLAVLLLDIDRFKLINDRYGHDMGDRVIVEIANILRRVARDADLTARLGGEEFVVLLPETSVEQAAILAERLRTAIAATPLQTVTDLRLTVSIGVAGSLESDSVGEILKQADLALYKAKNAGRNRVCLAIDDGRSEDGLILAQAGASGR
jgi:diguanylate cyclase (GGDEF)-like protein